MMTSPQLPVFFQPGTELNLIVHRESIEVLATVNVAVKRCHQFPQASHYQVMRDINLIWLEPWNKLFAFEASHQCRIRQRVISSHLSMKPCRVPLVMYVTQVTARYVMGRVSDSYNVLNWRDHKLIMPTRCQCNEDHAKAHICCTPGF